MTTTKKKPVPAKAKDLSAKLYKAAMAVLDERKAEGIFSVDLKGHSALADYIIIASGTSSRQVSALSNYLRKAFHELGVKPVRIEGLPQGDWVLIDAGDVLVHLFRPEVREYYQLEERWAEKDEE